MKKIEGSEAPKPRQLVSREAKIAALCALLGVAATLVGVKVSNYQLETAQQQLIVTDRPWVKIESIKEINLNVYQDDITIWLNLGMKNVGKSPATNISYNINIFTIGFYKLQQQIDYTCKYKPEDRKTMLYVLFPDEVSAHLAVGEVILRKPLDESDWSFEKFEKEHKADDIINSADIDKRYTSQLIMIVCASYDIYRDANKHYTASIYSVLKKGVSNQKIKKSYDEIRESSFDWLVQKGYTSRDLDISQPFGLASKAD